jgi:methylthioribulose-1-phosphate dehydratase
VKQRPFSAVAHDLAAIGRRFHARGWALGTSGNFSAVIASRPFRLAITASSVDKRTMRVAHVLCVDERGTAVGRAGGKNTPSAETLLHLEIVRRRGAGAVLHTHSVWNTMQSEAHAAQGGLEITGYEMLKGLQGVTSHEHRAWIPIVENDQDVARLAGVVGDTLRRHAAVHAVLLRRHGLYTWGATLADAERQVEILEFLFETIGRTALLSRREVHHGPAEDS